MSFKKFLNESNMAKATEDYPIPEPLKPFVDRLGEINFTDLENGETIYLQWLSGGKAQPRGNTSFLFVLNQENYTKYIEDAIRDLAPPFLANAPDFEALDGFLKSKVGDKPVYCSSYYSYDEESFVVDTYYGIKPEDLNPKDQHNPEKGNFFIQISDPDSNGAKKFGAIRDDDVYVYEYNEDNTIKSVRFRNIKIDGEFNYASKV
jgi:hypothetical protein